MERRDLDDHESGEWNFCKPFSRNTFSYVKFVIFFLKFAILLLVALAYAGADAMPADALPSSDNDFGFGQANPGHGVPDQVRSFAVYSKSTSNFGCNV